MKCQLSANGVLWDYVALPVAARTLPASRSGYWIDDRYVPTGYDWLSPWVPVCSGYHVAG